MQIHNFVRKKSTELLVIPVFGDWMNLPAFVAEAANFGVDMAIVNDGNGESFTATFAEMGCIVLEHETNLGVGAAIRSGLEFAGDEGYSGVVTATEMGLILHPRYGVFSLRRGAIPAKQL